MKRYLIEKLREWRDKRDRKPLIIKGARQVGKTYILNEFGREFFSNFHYINFEDNKEVCAYFKKDYDTKRILNELSFYFGKPIDTKRDLLIFDEIQECPNALTSLKYFNEKIPELAVCTAGSLLGIHLGEGSFPVGKVEFLHMYPMCFEEFLLGIGENQLYELIKNIKVEDEIPQSAHSRFWELLKIYFVVGGLPEVVDTYRLNAQNMFAAMAKVREKQQSIIVQYLADVAKHSGKVNAMHIERVFRNVPVQLAQELDGSASKFKFKDVVPGVNRYDRLVGPIDWLVSAGLVVKVPIIDNAQLPFLAHTKESAFKLYLFDVGILGALGGLSPKTILDYDYGTYKGYFAENFVAEEFLCSGAGTLFCWSERAAEVEFLREVDGNILPVEIKSGWVTQSKSLKVFFEKYKPIYSTIMSAKNLHVKEEDRTHYYPLYMAFQFPLKGN